MSDEHLNIELLRDLSTAPAGDPRRLHLQRCPRCQVWAESYAEFVDPSVAVPERDLEDAEARLGRWIDANIRGAASEAAPESGAGAASITAIPSRRSEVRFWRSPVWVLAACVVVAFGTLWVRGMRQDDARIVLRGQDRPKVPGDDRFPLQAPRHEADGSWSVRWSPVAGADAYQVRLYGTDLQEIGVLPSTTAVEARLSPEHLKVAGASETVFVEVTALRFSDVIATSRLVPLELH